jgi:hypothetical protein
MSSVIQTTFVLTGPLKGKTVNLGSLPYRFADGRTTLIASVEDTALHARFLERNWQAYPEGHPALEGQTDGQREVQTNTQQDGQHPVSSDVQPNGGGTEAGGEADNGAGATDPEAGQAGGVPDGDGQQAQLNPAGDPPPSEVNTKLQKAVQALDPADDNHWTRDGKPAMSAVEKLYGSAGITRADVEAAAPGWTREKAKAAAAQ